MLDRVQSQLPDLCSRVFGTAARVASVRPLGHGAESRLFFFELQREGGECEALVLKLHSTGPRAAAAEFRATCVAREQGFPAPALLHLERDMTRFGFAFVLMRYIEGQQLAEAIRVADPATARSLLRRFAQLLVELHRLDPAGLTDRPQGASASLGGELARYGQVLHELSVPALRPFFDWLVERRASLSPRGPCLIHQDYHPLNVLIDQSQRLHVVDWTLASVGDPRSDLALSFQLFTDAGFGHLCQPVAEDYVAAWGEPLGDMEFFEVFAALMAFAGRFAVLDDGERKRPALWARLSRRPGWTRQLERLTGDVARLRQTYETMRQRTNLAVPEVESLLLDLERRKPSSD